MQGASEIYEQNVRNELEKCKDASGQYDLRKLLRFSYVTVLSDLALSDTVPSYSGLSAAREILLERYKEIFECTN